MTSNKLINEAGSWQGVTTEPHRFNAIAFRIHNRTEFGHYHRFGVLDIPFSRKIRNLLIEEGKAEVHRFVPDSGWITFQVNSEKGMAHALWLLRLSYLYRGVGRIPELSAEEIRTDPALLQASEQIRRIYEERIGQKVHSRK